MATRAARVRAARAAAVVAVLGAVGATAACSLLVKADDVQCSKDTDCSARGPAFANAVCLQTVCVPPPDAGAPPPSDAGDGGPEDPFGCLNTDPMASDPTKTIQVDVLSYDALKPSHFGSSMDGGNDLTITGYTPQPGVAVQACSSLDLECKQPLGTAVTDDGGIAALSLPGSFTGFYSLTRDDSLPGLFYPGARLLTDQPMQTFATAMTSHDSLTQLSMALGIAQNQATDAGGTGILSVTQYDCNDRHVAHVTFTADPPPQQYVYLQNNFPSPTAKETAVEGSCVLVNQPPGSVQISSVYNPTMKQLMKTNVIVRPGTITLVYLRPRAR